MGKAHPGIDMVARIDDTVPTREAKIYSPVGGMVATFGSYFVTIDTGECYFIFVPLTRYPSLPIFINLHKKCGLILSLV